MPVSSKADVRFGNRAQLLLGGACLHKSNARQKKRNADVEVSLAEALAAPSNVDPARRAHRGSGIILDMICVKWQSPLLLQQSTASFAGCRQPKATYACSICK